MGKLSVKDEAEFTSLGPNFDDSRGYGTSSKRLGPSWSSARGRWVTRFSSPSDCGGPTWLVACGISGRQMCGVRMTINYFLAVVSTVWRKR